LSDKSVTDIPKTVEKQRYMTSAAPKAANPGKWVEQPRMPIPTGEHAVIECQGKIHSVAGYAKHRVDQNFHQVFDPKSGTWSLKAPFPLPCNHVAGVSIGSKIYTFGGFIEQNRCPHSKCFVYDSATDQWALIAGLSRPRGAMSAIVLDGKIHLLGGRDVRSVEWHEIYDPATDKYTILAGMRGSTGTQPFVGQRDHMGVAVVDGKIHAIAGRMDSYDFNTGLNAVYDPKTDAWTFRAPLPTPRSGPSCVYINGKIVVFGGEATGKVFGTNEAYDPKTDTWEQLTPMAIPRHGLHGATCAVIGNMVHVPGGGPCRAVRCRAPIATPPKKKRHAAAARYIKLLGVNAPGAVEDRLTPAATRPAWPDRLTPAAGRRCIEPPTQNICAEAGAHCRLSRCTTVITRQRTEFKSGRCINRPNHFAAGSRAKIKTEFGDRPHVHLFRSRLRGREHAGQILFRSDDEAYAARYVAAQRSHFCPVSLRRRRNW
jgi:N-acetylneuraminic acid mutarotase